MKQKSKKDRGYRYEKDKIWTVLDDPKEQETKEQSQEPDDIFAGMEELSEITDDELPF
ncbi:hypothetical protein LQK80_36540 [Bacillus thuringiensis]|nr:hypothetical protein [Bacillus thuringiensis]